MFNKGDYLSRISYMKVVHKGNNHLKVANEEGFSWDIGNNIAEKECVSASRYEEEVKLSKTELAYKLAGAESTVFTVNFNKKDGSERTLVGYLLEPNNILGYSEVIDLEKEKGNGNYDPRRRQVNHNEINWLILNGIKYVLK